MDGCRNEGSILAVTAVKFKLNSGIISAAASARRLTPSGRGAGPADSYPPEVQSINGSVFPAVKYTFRSFFSILDHGRVPEDVVSALGQAPASVEVAPPAAPEAPPVDRATQFLALLQRDGRLLDFLMEDLGAYGDAQVGAAARDVHAGCRAVLTRYLSISPVVDEEEGQQLKIERGTDRPASRSSAMSPANRPTPASSVTAAGGRHASTCRRFRPPCSPFSLPPKSKFCKSRIFP